MMTYCSKGHILDASNTRRDGLKRRCRRCDKDGYLRRRVLKPIKSDVERLEEKYVPEPMSGCWIWLGAIHSSGYGLVQRNKRNIQAHRESWRVFRGSFDESLKVLHKCDNRTCINPNHLFLGTQQDNIADMIAKGRFARSTWTALLAKTARDKREATHCKRGHIRSVENLSVDRHGFRHCKECAKVRKLAERSKRLCPLERRL
jgi:hypothetical protein